jgi:rare lipoprotein A
MIVRFHPRMLAVAVIVAAAGCANALGPGAGPSSAEPAVEPASARVPAAVPVAARTPAPTYEPAPVYVLEPAAPAVLEVLTGVASYYANSLAGRRTASGERYDPQALVAAHRTLPFGTILRVTNPANDRSVEVRVIDRGPFTRGRVLDLSRRAAEELDLIRRGVGTVRIEVLSYGG